MDEFELRDAGEVDDDDDEEGEEDADADEIGESVVLFLICVLVVAICFVLSTFGVWLRSVASATSVFNTTAVVLVGTHVDKEDDEVFDIGVGGAFSGGVIGGNERFAIGTCGSS